MATPASWEAAVTGRIQTSTLRALTNEDSETQNASATVNLTLLANAIDDAKAEFAIKSGMDPLLASPDHVGCVVLGVLAYLKAYKGVADDDTEQSMFRFMGKAKAIRDIATAAPGTTSDTTPSTRTSTTNRPIRPDADRSNFSRFLPQNRFNRQDYYGAN